MRFEQNQQGDRIIYCEEEEFKCFACGKKNEKYLHFCEQDKVLYCFACLSHGKGCSNNNNHLDYKIDRIEVVKNSRGDKMEQEMPELRG